MTLKLECGHIVTLEEGMKIYDYYDCRWVSIVINYFGETIGTDGWFDVKGLTKRYPETGRVDSNDRGSSMLNAERVCCAECAVTLPSTYLRASIELTSLNDNLKVVVHPRVRYAIDGTPDLLLALGISAPDRFPLDEV